MANYKPGKVIGLSSYIWIGTGLAVGITAGFVTNPVAFSWTPVIWLCSLGFGIPIVLDAVTQLCSSSNEKH